MIVAVFILPLKMIKMKFDLATLDLADGTHISHKIVEETVRHYKITLEGSTNYFANGLLTGDRNCPKNITLNILCNEKGE